MTLNKYYRQAVVYPFICVMALVITFSIVDNYNYKSEWLTADSVIFMIVLWGFFYSVIVCVLSLTIFLNKIEKVKDNTFLNLLSWFLLPLSFITLVLNHEIR